MDTRIVAIIGRDHFLQDLPALSPIEHDVLLAHSCVAPPVITDGSFRQVLIIDFDLLGGFDLLAKVRFLRRTAIIGLTDSAEISEKLGAQGIQIIFSSQVGTDTLLEAIRTCLEEMPAAMPNVNIQILIVDDEKEICDILSQVLKKRGYEILKAGDGEVALQTIKDNPGVGLVLLDIGLPSCGGMTVLSRIHQDWSDIAVLMITGLVDREVARQSMRLGAFDYITKPLDVGLIPDIVAAALSHRDYMQRPWWKRLMS